MNDIFQNTFKIVAIVIFLALGFGVFGAALGVGSCNCIDAISRLLFSGEKIFSVIVNQMLHTSASSHTHLEIDHPALDVWHHCMLR